MTPTEPEPEPTAPEPGPEASPGVKSPLQAAFDDMALIATLGPPATRPSSPRPTPPRAAPLHRVVSRWLVASATAGVVTVLTTTALMLAKEGAPRTGVAELVLRLAMASVVIAAGLSPIEGLAALARRLGGRRRWGLVVFVSFMPSLCFFVALASGMWLDAMEKNPDPTEALVTAADNLQSVGGGGLFSTKDLAQFVGVLTALLIPIGVARAWDARLTRTFAAGALGGLLSVGVVKLVIELEATGAPGPDAKVAGMVTAVAAAGAVGLWLGDRVEEWMARASSRLLRGRED